MTFVVNNTGTSPKFEYSLDGTTWTALSLFDKSNPTIGFSSGNDKGWITSYNIIYDTADKVYQIRVNDNGVLSNVVNVKCIFGKNNPTVNINSISGDEGTSVSPSISATGNGLSVSEFFVSFFSV